MCGRFSCDLPEAMLIEYFDVPLIPETYQARYNIAPTQPVLAIRSHQQQRHANMLRWGFVPNWMKADDISGKFINARSETIAEKPMFRQAFKQQRCLIIASGFYEWQQDANGKQPYYIHHQNLQPMAMAGLWSHWEHAEVGIIQSCTILTKDANPQLSQLHSRMPVILQPQQFTEWLDDQNQDRQGLQALIQDSNHLDYAIYPVSKMVNSPSHDSPDCCQPLVLD